MANEKRTDVAIASASSAAKELLSSALNELKNVLLARVKEQPRLFFPNGIELISITVKVSAVEVEFKAAGEKGISGLVDSGQSAIGLAGEIGEEVIEEQEDDS